MYVGRVLDLSVRRGALWLCFFFFQAEDGIRDLVRSRGLGDVYKRQVRERALRPLSPRERARERALHPLAPWEGARERALHPLAPRERVRAVSYTHLTLPTSDLV
mgnify:CR=1 FL=1